MEAFVKTTDFEALNVGLALYKGFAYLAEIFALLNFDRTVWRTTVKFKQWEKL